MTGLPHDEGSEPDCGPADLDGNDLAEVRRRVVDPVLGALLREDEIDSVTLRIGLDMALPGSRAHAQAVWLTVIARGERFDCYVCKAYAWPVSAEAAAAEVYEELQELIVAESTFGWGDLRTGDYVVPPPR